MVKDEMLKQILFPIIRAGLELNVEEIVSDIDYQQLLTVGKKHAILPIIRQGLMILGKTGEGYSQVDKQCSNDILRFAYRDIALESICNCFEKNSISYVLLKGSVLRDLYPDAWMRTSCDIDVLIKEKDIPRAVEALESETEFKYEKRNYHDVSMIMPHAFLELHFSIKEDMSNIDKMLSKAWAYVVNDANSFRCSFTKEYQIFHVIAHMSYHFVHGGLGIRPYIDLWLLRHKTEYDEVIVRKMCDQCGILKFYEECCYLSEVWLNNKPHSKISKALEEFSVSGGVFGNSNNQLLSRQRKYKGVNYILCRLFVSNEKIREMYPKAKKHPILLLYYQFRRWRKVFTNRKSIIQEIKAVNNTANSEIEAYDQLLKSVGM